MLITRHAEARALLADPRYVPPPVRQDGEPGTLAWLRSRVSRFSHGEVHAERRRVLTAVLATLDADALRSAAGELTLERGGDWRDVPTAVLGAALGFDDTGRLTKAVRTAATGYLSGVESPEADAAVTDLIRLAGGTTPESPESPESIARISLLLQAHAATEGLIDAALGHARTRSATFPRTDPGDDACAEPGGQVDGLLDEVLRLDPPLQATRRVDRRTGAEMVIDLVAVNRDPDVFADPGRFDASRGATPHLTFGAGLRPCPASRHGLALAAGVLEALLGKGHG
ncbi:cytochrome P450 [Nonomuraea sp. NPDC049714]|uniref:cytochrome P450 n=1 Tax=Nonomuraea sp. NPDC049714 TaxID=3364357 RepID=UPI00379249CF